MTTPMNSALLDPDESQARARPLRHWPETARNAVRESFAAMHRGWCADWLPDGATISEPQIEVEIAAAGETALRRNAAFWSFDGAPLSATGHATIDALTRALFGSGAASKVSERQHPGLADSVVRAAWADWQRRIAALLPPASPDLREFMPSSGRAAAAPWSGALWLLWSWCGGTWRLCLPHEAVAFLAGPALTASMPQERPTKARLEQALAREPVGLRVMLDGVELTLGQLKALRPGDTVLLEHPLDAPLKVVATHGAPLCEGWLGQSRGRMAIEMALPL